MVQRITKNQLILAIDYLNNAIHDNGSKLVLYLDQQSGFNAIRSKNNNYIFFTGTIKECKKFVDGAKDLLQVVGSW